MAKFKQEKDRERADRKAGARMKKPSKALIRTAYHEAGHAVAALNLRLGLWEVSIERGTGRKSYPRGEPVGHLGFAESRPTNQYRVFVKARRGDGYISNPRIRSSREDLIIKSFASPHAEKCYGLPDKKGWADDYNSARELALDLEEGDESRAKALLKKLYLLSYYLVADHWNEVECLARLLLAHGTVTAKQARAALRSSCGWSPRRPRRRLFAHRREDKRPA